MAATAAADAIFASIRPFAPPGDNAQPLHPASALTEHQLSVLNFLFSRNVERAMRILEKGCVERIVAEPSRRTAFKVWGETRSSEQYLCFPQHFCSCQSFWFEVVNREEQLRCKHQLAASLANALQICKTISMPDEEFAVLLYESSKAD